MSNLLSKLLSTGTIRANLLSDDNDILNCRDITPTEMPTMILRHSRKGCI